MGLAASQARLLSITSRKSSAQFESMRLSHQKLALSRSLTDVSNDYQNALNKTKLYYDFYGNGSTDNILSYDLLMRPSAINEYSPVLITNQQNRIVLSTNLAAAARAAGIPQEGLDGYIDTHTRNKFIGTLSDLGDIDAPTANVIQQTEYNPKVGLGYTSDVYMVTETDNYEVLEKRLQRTLLSKYEGLSANDLKNCATSGQLGKSGIMASTLATAGTNCSAQWIQDTQVQRLTDTESFYYCKGNAESFGSSTMKWNNLSLYDILYGSEDIILTQNVQRGVNITDAMNPNQYDDMINIIKTVIDLLADELEEAYGLDDSVVMAINQAYVNMNGACWNSVETPKLAVTTEGDGDYVTDVDGTGNGWESYIGAQGGGYVGSGEDRSRIYGSTIHENYKDDQLLVVLPCYSEWEANAWHQIFHANLAGYEFFRTAEDNPNGGSGRDYGYEPVSYWVSLPSTVAAGMSMQYMNIFSDGIHDYSSNTNNYDYDDIGEIDDEGNITYFEDVDMDEINENSIEGDGVNKARRNAMVNTINGAANNLALFNLYDCTGDYAACDHTALDNKNYSGNYGSINLSAFVQAWYTYFMQSISMSKLEDPDATDEEINAAKKILNGNEATKVRFHSKNGNTKLVTDSSYDLSSFTFEKAQVMVEDGIASIASFYDTIINQICEYGWTENNQVKEDTGYLQEMLQSGKMFLFKLANDNYYYQKGYSTDTFIKEIADETAIAEAEAKYKTQKARINAKEEELDVKMRNLDTEISALESEYEAVKKMISNNVQKSFSRYQS